MKDTVNAYLLLVAVLGALVGAAETVTIAPPTGVAPLKPSGWVAIMR